MLCPLLHPQRKLHKETVLYNKLIGTQSSYEAVVDFRYKLLCHCLQMCGLA